MADAIAFAEELRMMALVPGDDEAEGTDGDRVAIRDPAPSHLILVEVPKEVDRRRSNRLKFVGEIADRALVEPAGRDIRVLVEASNGLGVGAGEAESAVREDPLGIGEMADHFLDRPFARRVRIEAALVADRAEHAHRVAVLFDENVDEITLGDERDVAV